MLNKNFHLEFSQIFSAKEEQNIDVKSAKGRAFLFTSKRENCSLPQKCTQNGAKSSSKAPRVVTSLRKGKEERRLTIKKENSVQIRESTEKTKIVISSLPSGCIG